jgi:hypothetical protein
MSTGELTVIPEVIYLTKEKLKRRLKRSPTDQELATALKMSPSLLNSLKTVKVKYNETTLTPSIVRGAVTYRHAKISKKHRGNPFNNDKRYDSDSISGGKRKRRHTRRRGNKTKRSKQN